MKYTSVFVCAIVAGQQAAALPHLQHLALQDRGLVGDLLSTVLGPVVALVEELVGAGIPKSNNGTTGFDAKAQLVHVTGEHAFRAPGPGDARGPCPGLNALANHGYLPHNGFANVLELVNACQEVYGMGVDLALILAAYGGLLDGPLLAWSIGGKPHTGIGGSHNNYESDSSPLRGDLYQYGSNSDLVMTQFQELYDLQPDTATANYNLDVLKEFRLNRLQQSISQNPQFYYSPFSGIVVSQAAFVFIYRLMGNKSAEYPDGYLNKDVLKSFMSITGPEDNLTWVPGHERIPENWYKRNAFDQYSLVSSLGQDISYMSKDHPEVTTAGCNMGTVNSFVKIDATDLSGSAYTPEDALANPLCFGLAFANTLVNVVPIVSSVIQEVVLPVQNLLGCKTITSVNMSVAKACPGYSLYGGPTAPIAEGAIQG